MGTSSRIQPMTLANMRENGVHSITLWCSSCHRHADVSVDDLLSREPINGTDKGWSFRRRLHSISV